MARLQAELKPNVCSSQLPLTAQVDSLPVHLIISLFHYALFISHVTSTVIIASTTLSTRIYASPYAHHRSCLLLFIAIAIVLVLFHPIISCIAPPVDCHRYCIH